MINRLLLASNKPYFVMRNVEFCKSYYNSFSQIFTSVWTVDIHKIQDQVNFFPSIINAVSSDAKKWNL